jgi:hypothetical protein
MILTIKQSHFLEKGYIMETEKTKVIFRKFKWGEIIALFPEIAGSMDACTCMSYMHEGQHGAADCVGCTSPARPEEYQDLKKKNWNLSATICK